MFDPDFASGPELKAMREAAGMNRDTLAAALGVCPESVRQWEKGLRRPTPYMHSVLRAFEDGTLGAASGISTSFGPGDTRKATPVITPAMILEVRQKMGMSQTAFALLLELAGGKQVVSLWETGKVRPARHLCFRLARLRDAAHRMEVSRRLAAPISRKLVEDRKQDRPARLPVRTKTRRQTRLERIAADGRPIEQIARGAVRRQGRHRPEPLPKCPRCTGSVERGHPEDTGGKCLLCARTWTAAELWAKNRAESQEALPVDSGGE